jgi:hypothetical protein
VQHYKHVSRVVTQAGDSHVHLLVASFKMYFLVLVAVVACTCMNVYATNLLAGWAAGRLPRTRLTRICAIYCCVLASCVCHSPGCGKAPTEVPKTRTDTIQLVADVLIRREPECRTRGKLFVRAGFSRSSAEVRQKRTVDD